jgi:hypothetical protein
VKFKRTLATAKESTSRLLYSVLRGHDAMDVEMLHPMSIDEARERLRASGHKPYTLQSVWMTKEDEDDNKTA